MNPFSSSTRLRDTIQAVRSCKTAAEERAVVRKECAEIRAAISENERFFRHRNLAKLMFFHMLGYPTHFGHMECLKLIASPGFPEKRIGYLGLILLLDERQEILLLVTNSIKQDLNHTSQYIVGLALCALGNICSTEMARDLAPEVERLLQFRDPNICKKAALCTIRIIKKVPDLAEIVMKAAAALLKEKHHGVLLTGVQLCTDLSKASIEALHYFKKNCIEGLVRVLKDLANSPYTPEYDISGVTDPFLQIRVIKLLRALGQRDADASDTMNDSLAQVATKTESNKNAGNAILYECVSTIMSIEDNGGLRVLSVNILGRFLFSRDNNIRYVALNMLMKAVDLDVQAVQRHRSTILECVKDSDPSIRKRALELIYLLVNEKNVKSLTKELADYLAKSDPEFKGDLTEKVCSIVEKFSPDKIWYIDQMLKVLVEAGNYVKDEVWHPLIIVTTNAPNLHGYAVRSLYKAVQTAGEQETPVRAAVWCIGEYGDLLVSNARMLDVEDPITVTEADSVDVVETAIGHHSSDLTTQAMGLIALLKLSNRFPTCSKRINDIICRFKGSCILELQQRAIELNCIIEKHQIIRSSLVERMPVHGEATLSGRQAGSVRTDVSTFPEALPKIPNGVAKSSSPPLVDLLDLSSDDAPPTSSSRTNIIQDFLGLDVSPAFSKGNNQTQKSGTDALLNLLSIGDPPHQSSPSHLEISSSQDEIVSTDPLDKLASPSQNARSFSPVGSSSTIDMLNSFGPSLSVPVPNSPSYTPIVAFESSYLKVTFNFSKEPGSPQTTLIEAHIVNKSPSVYTNFLLQAAVPKFLQLHLDPASSNTLPVSNNGCITQKLRVTNNQHGKKSLIMRVRITYKVNEKDIMEEGQINNFPREL